MHCSFDGWRSPLSVIEHSVSRDGALLCHANNASLSWWRPTASGSSRSMPCAEAARTDRLFRQLPFGATTITTRCIPCQQRSNLRKAYLCLFLCLLRLGDLLRRQLQHVLFLTLLFLMLPILVLLSLLAHACARGPPPPHFSILRNRAAAWSVKQSARGGGVRRADLRHLTRCCWTAAVLPTAAHHTLRATSGLNHAGPASARLKTLSGWRGRGGVAWPTSHRTSASHSLVLVGATRWAPVRRVDVLKFECESHASYAT